MCLEYGRALRCCPRGPLRQHHLVCGGSLHQVLLLPPWRCRRGCRCVRWTATRASPTRAAQWCQRVGKSVRWSNRPFFPSRLSKSNNKNETSWPCRGEMRPIHRPLSVQSYPRILFGVLQGQQHRNREPSPFGTIVPWQGSCLDVQAGLALHIHTKQKSKRRVGVLSY